MGCWKLRKGEVHVKEQTTLADLNYSAEKQDWSQTVKRHESEAVGVQRGIQNSEGHKESNVPERVIWEHPGDGWEGRGWSRKNREETIVLDQVGVGHCPGMRAKGQIQETF